MDITPTDSALPPPTAQASVTRIGDRVFSGLSRGSGILLLVVMASIAVFLTIRATHAISQDHANFFTSFEWDANATPAVFGIGVLIYGTVVSSVIAMALAVPVAVGIALFISHYAPRRLATPLAYVVDLLAAIPSIIYGLWGAIYLVPHMKGLNLWLNDYLGWTGVFHKTDPEGAARSLFTVGILLAIMILPIITNVSREVFRQVPKMHEEAALALGATRWEVIRMSVLPFARSGIISASMLGLGRALGETMAVATVLSASPVLSARLLDPVGGTFAQNIAAKFGEASPFGRDALIASGLVLFVITLLVNGGARLIIARRKEYSGANA
ncbi:phosphate ABC transporter permease subunit PstC [Streptomyces sp. H10-C2]|uniref:phosphate ABC transporter permease subunit PstC n=1 Tax=unclassified Streptomyces TaxID=2593676 RepID=UPI0024B89796|nr:MULTISPECIES: phosphate ABC transporter permease subunit PstC [unclassified Streptomyces]MDJ0345104.1 phosphate ABC transporter permease subunit PstC [Streptomyces sp. PH10-H1]MDJ0374009.1 phosphate ABC transporter permease subunit PstC [Streptomyces sp. H10-C2]